MAWLLLGLIFALAIALHQQGFINAWSLPLGPLAIGLASGGLLCLIIASLLTPRWKTQVLRLLAAGFIGMNAIAYLGAYAATHHSLPDRPTLGAPKPINRQTPADFSLSYRTQRIAVDEQNREGQNWIETWQIPSDTSQGTVLMFPGKGGSKQQLLSPAQTLHNLGYQAILVDYQGVGGSSGSTTTIGVHEAQDVARVWQQVQSESTVDPQAPLVLYGVSMGTAAILRAIAHESVTPDAVILELPFTSLVNAVSTRLAPFKIPAFPMAHLMTFWGGVQHGFNGFAHRPGVDAKAVACPTLVLQGAKDPWIRQADLDMLMQHLGDRAQLVSFPEAGHHLLVTVDPSTWQQSVGDFLSRV